MSGAPKTFRESLRLRPVWMAVVAVLSVLAFISGWRGWQPVLISLGGYLLGAVILNWVLAGSDILSDSPTGKAGRYFAYLLVLLLVMRYGFGFETGDPAFIIVGLSGGWLVSFLSNRLNSQAGSIEKARADAYRELVPRLVDARTDLAHVSALIGREAKADEGRVGEPLRDSHGHSKRGASIAEIESSFEKANESFFRFLPVWEQSELLHRDLMPLGRALFRSQRAMTRDWDARMVALRIVAAGGKSVPPTPERSYAELLNELEDVVMRQAAFFFDFGRYLQNSAYGPLLGSELPDRAQNKRWQTLRQFVEASRVAGSNAAQEGESCFSLSEVESC